MTNSPTRVLVCAAHKSTSAPGMAPSEPVDCVGYRVRTRVRTPERAVDQARCTDRGGDTAQGWRPGIAIGAALLGALHVPERCNRWGER